MNSNHDEVRECKRLKRTCGDTNFKVPKTYSYDLVEQAGKLDPFIGRYDEITSVISILEQKVNNNHPLLIGESGVGKTAMVKGLAKKIAAGDVPNSLIGARVISLAMHTLVARDHCKGEFEVVLQTILKEVEVGNMNVVLFIDEVHLFVRACGSRDAAILLKLMLDKGRLRCIGATTPKEFKKYVEKEAVFERYFQQVLVVKPSVVDTISILRGMEKSYEAYHGIQILDSALVVAAQLSCRYITGFLPDKALDVVDEACATIRVQLDTQPKEIADLKRKRTHLKLEFHALEKEGKKANAARLVEVTKALSDLRDELKPLMIKYKKEKEIREEALVLREADVTRAVNMKIEAAKGVEAAIAKKLEGGLDENVTLMQTIGPVTRLSPRACNKHGLSGLAIRLQDRVVEQDEAVNDVADTITRTTDSFGRANQRTGVFLFVGPVGVGKTELAKALSAQLFDDERFMIRINMCDYMEEQSIVELSDSPPRYIGQLTEALRSRPHRVVLFDKVEKAHPTVFNALFQMFDDRHTIDFTNTMIIMTSNIGATHLFRALAQKTSMDNARLEVKKEVKMHFKPELIKRVDKIVAFNPLSHSDLRKVAIHELKETAGRLAERGVALGITEAALDIIVPETYNLVDGTGPIRKCIKKLVIGIAKMLIRDQIAEKSTICIHADSNGKDFSYRVDRDGEQKSYIPIQVPIAALTQSE